MLTERPDTTVPLAVNSSVGGQNDALSYFRGRAAGLSIHTGLGLVMCAARAPPCSKSMLEGTVKRDILLSAFVSHSWSMFQLASFSLLFLFVLKYFLRVY